VSDTFCFCGCLFPAWLLVNCRPPPAQMNTFLSYRLVTNWLDSFPDTRIFACFREGGLDLLLDYLKNPPPPHPAKIFACKLTLAPQQVNFKGRPVAPPVHQKSLTHQILCPNFPPLDEDQLCLYHPSPPGPHGLLRAVSAPGDPGPLRKGLGSVHLYSLPHESINPRQARRRKKLLFKCRPWFLHTTSLVNTSCPSLPPAFSIAPLLLISVTTILLSSSPVCPRSNLPLFPT